MDNNEMVFLVPGTKLNGRYVIEHVIGQGGFGITYYARHEILDHAYAIKEFYISGYCSRNTTQHTVSLQGMSDDMYDKYKQRFLDEAKTVFSLDHPNIVKVVDVFEENNTVYMVMPFIEGVSLQKMVENNGGPLPYELTVNYMGQLSDAVAYIHSKHILHRDIKPDNVLITSDNKVMLIDFGSAREFVNDKTQRHTSILTQGYAPLEQYNSVSRKGNYTDIYALGGVYYFCLTGTTPVDATARLLESGTGDDPLKQPKDLNPNVTEEVNRTIMKAMELRPENRHQTVKEFQDDLLGRNESKEIVDDALEMPVDDALEMPSETPKIEETPEKAKEKQPGNAKQEQPKDVKKKTFLGYDKKEWKTKWKIWLAFFTVYEVSYCCFCYYDHGVLYINRLINSVLWFIQAAVALGFFVWIIRLISKKKNSDIVWPFIISGLGIVSIIEATLFNIHYSGIEFFILAMIGLAAIFVYRPEKFKTLPYIVMTAMLTWLCIMTDFMKNFFGEFLHNNLHYYWQLSYSNYLDTLYVYELELPRYRFVLGYDDLLLFVAIPTITLLVIGIINAKKTKKKVKENKNESPVETKPETAIPDEQKPESPKKKKSKAWWIILIILILGGAGFAIWQHQENLRQKELNMYYSCYDANSCRRYLKAYPNGKHRYEVNNSLNKYVNDSIAEVEDNLYRRCNTVNDCNHYLQQFPNGRYVNNVTKIKEDILAYNNCRTLRDYENYLSKYPSGKYVNEVKAKIKELNTGVFSVSATKKVYFSKGNLQYQASTNTWRFAEHQWDYIGEANKYISSYYSGWIDLFGWGTSGYNGKYPYMTSKNYYDYGNGNRNISGTNYDWGVYNTISNGDGKSWRTLTIDEWAHVLYNRSTNSGIRFVRAVVNNVQGVIILPDTWDRSFYTLNRINNRDTNCYGNVISYSDWINKLEANGAVFLPSAGFRDKHYSEILIYDVGVYGIYSSSTVLDNDMYVMNFFEDYLYIERGVRDHGYSVRLVSDL